MVPLVVTQVELHTDLERRLPKRLLEMVDKTKVKVYPNRSLQRMKQMWSKMMFIQGESEGNRECRREYNFFEQELFKQKNR